MSASPVSSPLLSQTAQTAQAASPADDQQSPAFASVLKQQQQSQSQTDKSDSTQPTTQASAKSDQTSTPAAQASAKTADAQDDGQGETAAAASDDATQTALQQLLPWLQALQGKAGDSPSAQKSDKKDATTADATATDAATALQQAAAVALQTQTTNQTGNGKAASQKDADGSTGALTAKTPSATASATAKLAVAEDASADGKGKPDSKSGFDTVLNVANTAGQAAQAPQTGATQQAATTNSQPTQMQSPLGTPQWQNELGNRVQLMSNNNESRAELVLTPPQLGRIEVSLHVHGDQASATFVSANPDVRNALQNSMDHLRQVLAGSGIALGQTHVGAESSGQSFANSQSGHRNGSHAGGGAGNDTIQSTASVGTVWTRQSNNMLDVFA